MTKHKEHPLATLLPMMPDSDLQDLGSDRDQEVGRAVRSGRSAWRELFRVDYPVAGPIPHVAVERDTLKLLDAGGRVKEEMSTRQWKVVLSPAFHHRSHIEEFLQRK